MKRCAVLPLPNLSLLRRLPLSRFDLADALSDVLIGFSIHLGDRGELLVAAFFTWARDAVMVKQPPQFCRHFSVKELFSCLVSKRIAKLMFNHTPSISPSRTKQRTFGEVATSANMHFNHFIQSQEREFISRTMSAIRYRVDI